MREMSIHGPDIALGDAWSSLAPAREPAKYNQLEIVDVPRRNRGNIVYPRRYNNLTITRKRAFGISKRVLDITLSALALICLTPAFFIIAAAIYLQDGGSPFFIQERAGKNGKSFRMYKFRTMIKDAPAMHDSLLPCNEMDGPAFKMTNDPRVTKVGHILRKHGIDELPQLINIIKGDMSIVGPRPLPVYEQDKCDDYQNQRLMVRPGLLCFWQCDPGKNTMPFDEWIELDLKYITERSLLTDIRIILRTLSSGVLENNS